MERWFLDTNVWNYLHHRPDRKQEALRDLRSNLLAAARARELLIVGSLPLLQEVISAGQRNPDLLDRMRPTIFEAVANHWLVPLNQRHAREIARGEVLPPSLCYLPRETRRRLEELAKRESDIHEVANGTHAEVSRFKEEHEAIRLRLRETASVRDGLSRSDFRRDLKGWWQTVDVAGWIRDALKDDVLASAPDPDDLSMTTAPSAWHFTRFKLARILLNLAENRAIKASDYVDAEHYAAAPYFDVLVTDDGPFKETIALLDDCPFRVMSFDQFEDQF